MYFELSVCQFLFYSICTTCSDNAAYKVVCQHGRKLIEQNTVTTKVWGDG